MNFPITRTPKPPFEIENADSNIRSAMEAGYEISRPRFTKVRKNIGLKWDLSNDEYLILDEFYCMYGSSSFTLSFNTIGSKAGDYGITISKTVKFTKSPKYSYQGMGNWEASCEFREI